MRELGKADPRVRVISHGRNRGYGEALRTGFLASRLDHVFFTDADLQFDLDELEQFVPTRRRSTWWPATAGTARTRSCAG